MTIRMLFGVLCCCTISLTCGKQITREQSDRPPQSGQDSSQKSTQTTYSDPKTLANHLQPEIVRTIQAIDASAWNYYLQGNLLESRRFFEEGLDIIAEYEEDENHIKYPEYIKIKNNILKNFREVLRMESFEINETDSDILQQEIDILRVMQNAELESDITPNALPTIAGVKQIPRIMNSSVQKWISRFAYGDQRKHFKRWIERSGKYLPMIFEIIDQEGMPRDLAYLAMIESGYNPTVTSYAKAVGLWQFISATAKRNGLTVNGYVDERRNPVKATRAAVKHLRDLYFYYNENWFLGLAGYNVSERRIRLAMKRYKTDDFWKLGWPLPRQTRDYIPKFLAAVEIMKNPRKFGFTPPEMRQIRYDDYVIDRQASLDVIAQAAGVHEEIIRELNPELKIYITPEITANNPFYTVQLPEGTKGRFSVAFNRIPKNELVTKLLYNVRMGDTISEISELFKVSTRQIMLVNNIRDPRKLRIGQKITIPRPSSGFTPQYIENSISASTAPAVPADAELRQKIEYSVKKNDTLWDIAQAHNVSVRNMKTWNGLSRNRYIYPDQTLIVWQPQSAGNKVRARAGTNSSSIQSSRPAVHTVRRGESVARIGKLYNISVKDLLAWNNLTSRSIIYPGDTIDLNSEAGGSNELLSTPGNENTGRGEIVYTVRRGDTLWDIARFHGTSINEIKRWNNLRSSNLIRPGDRLTVPISLSSYQSITHR